MWIRNAGEIVDAIVKEKRLEGGEKKDIEVLAMDELYTYIKKNLEEIRKQGDSRTPIPEYGQLWTGTDLKLFRLK